MLSQQTREIGDLLDAAIREVGSTRTAVASDLGMDAAQISRWIAGDAHQMLDRLLRLEPAVLRRFAALLAVRCGVCVVPDAMLDAVAQLAKAICERQPLRMDAPAVHGQRRVG